MCYNQLALFQCDPPLSTTTYLRAILRRASWSFSRRHTLTHAPPCDTSLSARETHAPSPDQRVCARVALSGHLFPPPATGGHPLPHSAVFFTIL
ncbi:hypothetical protein A2U01_0052441 [Trifolium medium]|uniref:Uncharacterized protein n=1 Tax=Trifolium medium TaxID=97028 RepID=A0A392R4S2_9FABA|nr:hypothetical protein [Trifolium medium]